MIVIGHDIDYSYLGLGITNSQPFWNTFLEYLFCEGYFVIVLYVLSLFCSCIAKGLTMCRLGGVISNQKVLF